MTLVAIFVTEYRHTFVSTDIFLNQLDSCVNLTCIFPSIARRLFLNQQYALLYKLTARLSPTKNERVQQLNL